MSLLRISRTKNVSHAACGQTLACNPKTVPHDLRVQPTGQVLLAGRFTVKPANDNCPRYRAEHDENQRAYTSTDRPHKAATGAALMMDIHEFAGSHLPYGSRRSAVMLRRRG
jgi:hypothetical protein